MTVRPIGRALLRAIGSKERAPNCFLTLSLSLTWVRQGWKAWLWSWSRKHLVAANAPNSCKRLERASCSLPIYADHNSALLSMPIAYIADLCCAMALIAGFDEWTYHKGRACPEDPASVIVYYDISKCRATANIRASRKWRDSLSNRGKAVRYLQLLSLHL